MKTEVVKIEIKDDSQLKKISDISRRAGLVSDSIARISKTHPDMLRTTQDFKIFQSLVNSYLDMVKDGLELETEKIKDVESALEAYEVVVRKGIYN